MPKPTFARDKIHTASQANLIQPLTSFIGRKKELAQVRQLLTQARLLTLTGVGGCGKTRLARQVAMELAAGRSFEGGVWFVELAALNDPALVAQEVAQTLGIREMFDQSAIASLIDHLADRQLLLLLDNCEHLLAACAELAENLLLASPKLQILATSREPLGIPGETSVLVPSLSLPQPVQASLPTDLTNYDAPALFLDRARSVLPSFVPTEQNMAAIIQVCRRLDGIPLAIELGAARVNVLTVEQIAARLDDRFNLLTSSNRTAVLPRHQTLRETIDWSYQLLSEEERTLFRRLAVFAGGFTLDAVEAICTGAGLQQNEILDTLARLVSKSLVVADILEQREARYHLLETIRQYALDLLRESGEENKLRDRHLAWFRALAEKLKAQWRGPRQKELFDQLEIEHDNLRAALEWSKSEFGSVEAGLLLGSALWRFWEIQNHLREGLEHLTDLLALPQAQAHTAARAKALYGAGYLALMQGLARDYTASESLLNESLAIARERNEPQLIATAIYGLGVVARFRGDHERAEELLQESLRSFRQFENRVGTYISLYNLAEAATTRGDLERAKALHEESLALKRAQNDEWSVANSLMSLATIARLQNNTSRAMDLIQESLTLFLKIGDTANIAFCLREISALASLQGHSQFAVQLYAFADTSLDALGYPSGHAYREQSEHPLASVQARMGESRFHAAWESGRSLTLDQAIEQARGLGSLPQHKSDSQAFTAPHDKDQGLIVSLNERELEVLRLIADGLSNQEIAARLVIALSTVKWHINNLFGKLGVRSRTQAIAQAKELGLL
ncbi:MAG TPA: LuxR C-terminal-related transcriptional regulator [Anaerolineales bacterium]|nr:LuxR C-terminal-related transcriptional regulator [Anaerolineales bacterium]